MGFRRFTRRIRAILVMQCPCSKQKSEASESLAWQRSQTCSGSGREGGWSRHQHSVQHLRGRGGEGSRQRNSPPTEEPGFMVSFKEVMVESIFIGLKIEF